MLIRQWVSQSLTFPTSHEADSRLLWPIASKNMLRRCFVAANSREQAPRRLCYFRPPNRPGPLTNLDSLILADAGGRGCVFVCWNSALS